MEGILSEEIQEVAEPVEEVVETSEQTQEVAEPEPQQEAEQPKVEERDYEKDAAFAKMRRSMEQYQKDFEAMKAEKERLANALGWYGFKGTTDEIEDQAKAHYTGRSIEEVRQERIAEAQKIAEENSLKEQLKYYKEKEVQERMNKDLSDIQKINPLIKTFGDLPQEYFDLVSRGIEGTRAYKLLEVEGMFQTATQQAEQKAVAKIQANAKASVGSASGGVSEPVSYANMSDAEFDKLLAKVKRGEMTSIT
jgi:hypothetical protein